MLTHSKIIVLFLFFFTGSAFAQSVNNKPKLNQLGFYPESPKLAITPETDAATFHLRNVADGTVVYQGTLSAAASYSLSGETVRIADFSDFKTPGEYVLYVDGGSKSYPFKIGDGVFSALSAGLIKALYFNRASIPLEEEYAGLWHRPAGHPDNSVLIHGSAATDNRPEESTISSSGGWYDAGDYNKYIVPISSSIHHMLFAYEQFPAFFDNLDLNIPESDNVIPDVLNEALYALRWMLTMQDPDDGGVYHKLTHANFQGTVMPHAATASRYVVQKGTAATLDFAAVMAQAARVYENMLPDFADSALTAAEFAWEWAEENPSMAYKQGDSNDPAPGTINAQFDPNISTGEYGDGSFSDEKFWASSELYITTGNEVYFDSGGWSGVGVSGWGNVQALGLFSLLHHRKNLTSAGLPDTSAMKQALINGFDWYVNSGNNSAYRSPFGIQSGQFGWGSNGRAGNLGMGLFMLYQTTGEAKYYESAMATLDYLLGRNAVGYSYVTGFGDKTPMNIHHRQSEADNVNDPVPGWVAGGANPGQQDGCSYSSDLPALSYSDTYCSYASNEITTYWNSPFIYLTAGLEYLTPDYTHIPTKTIILTAPVADSLYDVSSEISLEWTSTDVNTVDIYYKIFMDDEFTELASGVDASSGIYSGFEIPDLPGDSLLFRIEDTANEENWAQSAIVKIKPSKAITEVRVSTQFNFTPGARLYINWTTIQIESIDLYYRLHHQEEYTEIVSELDAEGPAYSQFYVPDAPGDTLYIRIQDSGDSSIFAESEPISIVSSVSNEDEDLIPENFVLKQNYPNPFNPTTIISYKLPVNSNVRLAVFDMTGRKVATLLNEKKPAGTHSVHFDASSLSSGIYIYKLVTGEFTSTKKMLLIK
ncbi:MAG: glycoside hydrolase family 9 protein [Gracilimonas sp.]